MQGSGPSFVIAPPAIEPGSASILGISPMILVICGVVLVAAYIAVAHRRRGRIDPRELAFRSISHKLGLSRSQINTIRRQSVSMGLPSPIGIVMSPELIAQALSD